MQRTTRMESEMPMKVVGQETTEANNGINVDGTDVGKYHLYDVMSKQ